MIYTARQLEALHKASGRVTVPRAARFTPLAMDWLRAKRITVQYADGNSCRDRGCRSESCAAGKCPGGCGGNGGEKCPCGTCASGSLARATPLRPPRPVYSAGEGWGEGGREVESAQYPQPPSPYPSPSRRDGLSAEQPTPRGGRERGPEATGHAALLWWSDGDCGPAKAAIVQAERDSNLSAMPISAEVGQTHRAVKELASAVASGRATGGILIVQHAAAAMLFANRCPSLRAVLGTSIDAVDAGIRQIAANVLVIEHPRQTLQQVRNLISRFLRGGGRVSDELDARLKELATCA